VSYHHNAEETGFAFVKSTYSNDEANCVELAIGLPGEIAVRDSKNPCGPALRYPASAVRHFIEAVATGGLDSVS
jgi:hypothetical protein